MMHSLKYGAIALLLLLVTSPLSLAHNLFGETGERWGQGSALEQKGDFDAAIIQYNRALQAIRAIDDQQLRDCAAIGTIARLEGAMAGKRYIQTYGRDANALRSALEASQNRFRAVMAASDAKRPELATSCP